MDADDLALEVRRLRCLLRDTQNRFAEEGARLNTEIAYWKLKFFEAYALIPVDAEIPLEGEVGGDCIECALAREDALDVGLVDPHG